MNGRFVLESSSASSSFVHVPNNVDPSASSMLLVDTILSSDMSSSGFISLPVAAVTSPWSPSSSSGSRSSHMSFEQMNVNSTKCPGGYNNEASPGSQGFLDLNSPGLILSCEQTGLIVTNVDDSNSWSTSTSPMCGFVSNEPSSVASSPSSSSSSWPNSYNGSRFNLDAVKNSLNLNSASNASIDEDDAALELHNVSDDSFSVSSSPLPELNSSDLELLEHDFSSPSPSVSYSAYSPPLTPSPSLQCCSPQQEITSIKIEPKIEPTGMYPSTSQYCFSPARSPAMTRFIDRTVPQNDSITKKYPNTKDCLHVAELLCSLLADPNTCGDNKLIKWEKREKGLFRIVNPKEVANRWARAKSNKEKMNYPNMARGIRFARVKSGDFELVTKSDGVGKKLVYKFSQRFRSRNSWLSSIMEAN